MNNLVLNNSSETSQLGLQKLYFTLSGTIERQSVIEHLEINVSDSDKYTCNRFLSDPTQETHKRYLKAIYQVELTPKSLCVSRQSSQLMRQFGSQGLSIIRFNVVVNGSFDEADNIVKIDYPQISVHSFSPNLASLDPVVENIKMNLSLIGYDLDTFKKVN